MRIAKLKKSAKEQKEALKELAKITRAKPPEPPVCSDRCTTYRESRCHRNCPEAPAMLSSEPGYPLEQRITPVVFELKRLGVFHPCWSCEGHNGLDGELWKLPRVWFYARSDIHVRVLADSLAELYLGGKLNVPWEVALTVIDQDNTDTSYSLQPNLKDDEASLQDLHLDLASIAVHLRQMVISRAEQLAAHTGAPRSAKTDRRTDR